MSRFARIRGTAARRSALVLAAASMALIGSTTAASAAGPVAVGSTTAVPGQSGGLINVATGYCLGSIITGPNSVAVAMETDSTYCHQGFSSLTWSRGLYGSTGYYALINSATNRCLDTDSSGTVSMNLCNGQSSQQWYEVSTDGPNPLENLATHECLDSNDDGGLYADPCNWGSFQAWEILQP